MVIHPHITKIRTSILSRQGKEVAVNVLTIAKSTFHQTHKTVTSIQLNDKLNTCCFFIYVSFKKQKKFVVMMSIVFV